MEKKEVTLRDGISYILKRDGQRHPQDGDEVIVAAELYLPMENGFLKREIQFGDRVQIGGANLSTYYMGHDPAFMDRRFRATTWAEAFDAAEAWAASELKKLTDALDARAAALVAAELPPAPAEVLMDTPPLIVRFSSPDRRRNRRRDTVTGRYLPGDQK